MLRTYMCSLLMNDAGHWLACRIISLAVCESNITFEEHNGEDGQELIPPFLCLLTVQLLRKGGNPYCQYVIWCSKVVSVSVSVTEWKSVR